MRRFVEEIRVQDPMVAERIIKALETKSEDKRDPVFEIDMFDGDPYEPISNKARSSERPYCVLRIFLKEDLEQTVSSVGF